MQEFVKKIISLYSYLYICNSRFYLNEQKIFHSRFDSFDPNVV